MSRHDNDERDERDRREGEERRQEREDRGDRESDDSGERPKRHLHRERGVVLFADQSGSIIRAGDEALEDDLPVLNAFRQFLDAERRRARRQLITLIAVFTVILLGLAGGGFWFVRNALHKVEAGLETDKVRYEEERLSTVSNLQNVAKVAVSLKKDVLDTRNASSVIQEKVKAQSTELTRLLDTITTLEIQNSTLQRSVGLLDKSLGENGGRGDPDVPAAPPPASLPQPGPRQPYVPAPAPAPAAEPAPSPVMVLPPSAPAPAPGVISDRTPGGVPFRLPLPKE